MTILSSSSRMRSAETISRRGASVGRGADQRLVGDQLEAGEEPRGAQHAQRVVAEGDLRVERRREPVLGEVRRAAERVDEPQGREVERHRVDREVAPRQVDLDVVAEGDGGLARVGPVDLRAVGRDLEGPPADPDADRAEGPALLPDLVGDPTHEPEDLVGTRVGRAVEVDRVEVDVPDERVAHRAAHEVEAAVRTLEDLGERRGGLEQRPQARRDTRRGHSGEGTSPRCARSHLLTFDHGLVLLGAVPCCGPRPARRGHRNRAARARGDPRGGGRGDSSGVHDDTVGPPAARDARRAPSGPAGGRDAHADRTRDGVRRDRAAHALLEVDHALRAARRDLGSRAERSGLHDRAPRRGLPRRGARRSPSASRSRPTESPSRHTSCAGGQARCCGSAPRPAAGVYPLRVTVRGGGAIGHDRHARHVRDHAVRHPAARRLDRPRGRRPGTARRRGPCARRRRHASDGARHGGRPGQHARRGVKRARAPSRCSRPWRHGRPTSSSTRPTCPPSSARCARASSPTRSSASSSSTSWCSRPTASRRCRRRR